MHVYLFVPCRNATVAQEGTCPEDVKCACAATYRPICGKDNNTYGNRCSANCA